MTGRALTEVAAGVFVAESEIWASNTVVVVVDDGGSALLVDPGITAAELEGLAGEFRARGLRVAAGAATHPHWDHVLWHAGLGEVPRFASARGHAVLEADRARSWREASEAAPGLDEALFGVLSALPDDADELPPPAPSGIAVVRHDAHAPGHLAFAAGSSLLVGDMLSQREVPLLDVGHAGEPRVPPVDPVGDYRAALDVLEGEARRRGADVLVPGHGPVTRGAAAIAELFARDRAYLDALEREAAGGERADDPRLADEWVAAQHAVHLDRLRSLAG
ncbi:MBL fold metallo-hydrolase [Microbacterium paludicola]|uniref:MBL fold metallo-hydrolase n=1 Tax=Microbacterium paludicola TaxID=300019 RepID=UPI00387A738B